LNRRHVIEFCFGLYRARTGRYKSGRSQLPRKIREFLEKLFAKGYMTESLRRSYGLGAWVRQESAFGDVMMEDTYKEFIALCKQEILGGS
jgi:hypothetical protein